MVNWSICNVLDDSAAGGHSKEGLAFTILPWLHVLGLNCQLGQNLLLLLNICEFVEEIFLLKFSVLEEHVKRCLTDWQDMLKYIPKDTLSKWSGCQ